LEVNLATLSEAAHAVARAKDAVVLNALESLGMFNHAVDGLLARVEEYRRRWLAQVQLLGLAREKELEAQADLLDVSAGQLDACVALGRAAVVSGDGERVWEAAQTAKAMEGLLAVPTRLCTGTRVAVLCDLSSTLAALEEGTRLQQFEVDAARSSVSGDGLASFAKGGKARNVIQVTCMGMDGLLVDGAYLEDAHVGLTVNGTTWQAASAVFSRPGVIEVTYVVEEEGPDEVELSVSLRGVTVPGGPWRALASFLAEGVYIGTLPVGDWMGNTGLAVSSDGRVMVVSNLLYHRVSVYRTEDGSHVRTFGGLGVGPGQFERPRGLCMTAHDTVLVAEYANTRIQEVTLEGAHVKFIPLNVGAYRVAVHGDTVAVSTIHASIRLYSYTTGARIREIPTLDGRNWNGICVSPDGEHLAASCWQGCITLLSMDGHIARSMNPMVRCCGLAFTSTGDVVGVHQLGVSVFSATDGTILRSWGFAGSGDKKFALVSDAVVSGNRLYILDGNRVQVFH